MPGSERATPVTKSSRWPKTLNAPVAHTSRSKEFIEPGNPFNVGMTGILGNHAGMEAVSDCDLLLCLGTDFAYSQFYPRKAKIIQVDIDATNLGKRSPVDIGVVGDVAATLEQLTPLLKQREKSHHLDRALENWKADRKDYKEQAKERDRR